METLIGRGRCFFSVGIICLGVLGIALQDFIVGRPPPWPAGSLVNPTLAYISGGIFVLAGIAIWLRKRAATAALLVGLLIVLFSILRHLLQFQGDWANGLKSLALFGGTLIAACSFFEKDGDRTPGFLAGERLRATFILFGIVAMSAFLIGCGILHIQFAGFVKDFIPAYIPFRAFWTYFTAVALLAGGAGLLFGLTRKLAAAASGLMIFLWFILLHIPRVFATPRIGAEWMGLFESLTIAGILLLLAGVVSTQARRE